MESSSGREVRCAELRQIRRARDVDDEVLAGLIARDAILVDDQKGMPRKIASAWVEQHGIARVQLICSDCRGEICIEGGRCKPAG
jgi:hypothetical protein